MPISDSYATLGYEIFEVKKTDESTPVKKMDKPCFYKKKRGKYIPRLKKSNSYKTKFRNKIQENLILVSCCNSITAKLDRQYSPVRKGENDMEFLQDNLRVFVVPLDILHMSNLSTHEKMVYMVLRSFANPHKPEAFPSYETIGELGSMTRRHAINCVNKLVEKGLIQKEIRLDVTKNRKIKNTSNLYTLKTPKVVQSEIHSPSECDSPPLVNVIHPPSECDSPPLVNVIHPPSECDSPEHNHLTKSFRTKSFNNNKNNNNKKKSVNENPKGRNKKDYPDVVVDLLSKHEITVNKTTLTKWRKIAKDETIVQVIKETLERPCIKNVVGYVTKILKEGYTSSTSSKSLSRFKKSNIPEYIINQIQQEQVTTTDELDEEKKQQAIELLRALGEIE